MWSIRTKQKLKEQNSSRLTDPKNGLTVGKGKGTGEGGWHREGSIAQRTPMPVMFIKAIPADKQDCRSVYPCQWGPTYIWTFNLKMKENPSKWILAGVPCFSRFSFLQKQSKQGCARGCPGGLG